MNKIHAFSLIELSIVLVILGLLTGGILGGKSLIRAAELRSITTDVTKYQTATIAFEGKYFALPGDLPNASSFWSTVTFNGDGDGEIEKVETASTEMETFHYWNHLAHAGMISGEYDGTSNSLNGHGTGATLGVNAPAGSIANTGFQIYTWDYITLSSTSRFSYYYKNNILFGAPKASNGRLTGAALLPEEAWSIDTKFDDGHPAYGSILGVNWDDECSTVNSGALNYTNYDARYRVEDDTLQCALHFRDLF